MVSKTARRLDYELISPLELLVDVWRVSKSSPFFRLCLHTHLNDICPLWTRLFAFRPLNDVIECRCSLTVIVFDAILTVGNWREGLGTVRPTNYWCKFPPILIRLVFSVFELNLFIFFQGFFIFLFHCLFNSEVRKH